MDRNLRLLGIGVGFRTFGSALYFPFLALFLHNVLNVDYIEVGVILAGIGLFQVPFSLVGGLVTDRVGRRNLILFGLAAEAVATLGLAYAFELRSLPAAILAGVAGGSIANAAGPAFSAYIADFAFGAQRTRGFTWFRIGLNAGFAAGVTVGGVLVSTVGFAWAVGLAAAVIGAGFLVVLVGLDPSPFDRAIGRPRALGRPGTPYAGTVPANPPPPSRPLRESLQVLARDRVALEVAIGFLLAGLIFGQWSVTFPLFVHNVLGVSYYLLGIGLALNGVVVVFGQSRTTEAIIGMRHTTIFLVGIVLFVLAFLGLGIAGLWSFFPLEVFFVAVVVLTIGENLSSIPLTTLPSNLAPPTEVGSYNGAFQMIGGIGFLVAFVFGGAVLSFTSNPAVIWLILCVPAVPAVVLVRRAARRMAAHVDRA